MLSLLLTLLLALIVLAASAWLAFRSSPPVVKLIGLRPERLTTTAQRLRVKLRVQNPGPLPLPVRAMTYRVWLDEREIATGAGDFSRWIPARGDEIIEVEVSANAKDLARALPALALKRQPWPYRLAGSLTPIPGLHIGYDQRGEIDAQGILKLAASLR
jgi:LEA14-like dessication related protein